MSGVGCSIVGSCSPRRASRRHSGPTMPTTISSSSCQAARALRGRLDGSLASIRVTHAASAGWGAGWQRRDRVRDVLHQHRNRRAVGVERHRAGEQLVGDDAGLIKVGPRPDLLRHRLFGGHVGGRPDGRAGRREHLLGRDPVQRLGDPEVGDLDAAVGRDQQVLGLDVAVNDLHRFGVRERREQALEHPGHLRKRHPPDERPQRSRSRYSIAIYGIPSCSRKSNTVTTLGWLNEPATRASRMKRSASEDHWPRTARVP